MAERRMFSKKVVDSDAFINMPMGARLLYYEISMHAMDRGYVNNAYSIARCIGATAKDVETLEKSGFIRKTYDINKGDFIIVHWYENNGIGETAKKRNNYSYRKWRDDVLERDKNCMLCGSTNNLVVHHKKSFADYPELRTELNNGITLCDSCHKKLHKGIKENGSRKNILLDQAKRQFYDK